MHYPSAHGDDRAGSPGRSRPVHRPFSGCSASRERQLPAHTLVSVVGARLRLVLHPMIVAFPLPGCM